MTPEYSELLGYLIGYALGAFGIGWGCGWFFTALRRLFDNLG